MCLRQARPSFALEEKVKLRAYARARERDVLCTSTQLFTPRASKLALTLGDCVMSLPRAPKQELQRQTKTFLLGSCKVWSKRSCLMIAEEINVERT